MKKRFYKAILGKDLNFTALLAVGILIIVGLGCGFGKSSSSNPVPSQYLGVWKGQDGSMLTIRGDGKGDYKSGGTTVDGGTVNVDEAKKEFSITFFNIGPTLRIDSPPNGDQMTLGNVIYRRDGGGGNNSTTATDTKGTPDAAPDSKKPVISGDTADNDTPPNSEVESLVKDTMADFTEGVEKGDFITLYSNASKDFQASYTAPQLNTSFSDFISKKAQVLPILNSIGDLSPRFSSPPSVRTEKGYKILSADGDFPTRPNAAKFETEYELQNGDWKLLKIKVLL